MSAFRIPRDPSEAGFGTRTGLPVSLSGVGRISTLPNGDTTVVVLRGVIDLALVRRLQDTLARLVQGGRHIVLDISDAPLIDCACLGVIMQAYLKACERGVHLALAAPSPLVTKALRATALTTVIPVFPHRRQAMASIRTGSLADIRGATRLRRRDPHDAHLAVSGRWVLPRSTPLEP